MSKFIKKNERALLGASLFLLAPYAFYFGKMSDWATFSAAITQIRTYAFYWMPIAAYLLLFFAFFVKRAAKWHDYFIVTAWLFLVGGIVNLVNAWHMTGRAAQTIVRNVFIQISGNWPVGVLMSLSLIILTGIALGAVASVAEDLESIWSDFIKRIKSPLVLLLGACSLILVGALMYWQIHRTREVATTAAGMGYKGGAYSIWIYGTLVLVVYTLMTLTGITFFFATVDNWWREFMRFTRQLRDFRLKKYIYRTLSGYLYTITYLGVVAFAAVAVPAYTMAGFEISRSSDSSGVHLLHWLFIPGALLAGWIITYVVLLAIRIVIETTVALVHVAQNTSKLR